MQALANAKKNRHVLMERFAPLWETRHAVDDGIANYGLVRDNLCDGRAGQLYPGKRRKSAQLLLDASAALLELTIPVVIAVLAWLAYRIAAYIAATSLIGGVASFCVAAALLIVGYAGFDRRSLDDR